MDQIKRMTDNQQLDANLSQISTTLIPRQEEGFAISAVTSYRCAIMFLLLYAASVY